MDIMKNEVHRIVLGIHAYLAKTEFERVVIGVSGGMDSALVATLAQMALGAKNVHFLLMPSDYSSPDSQRLGEELAKNLGCSFDVFSIQSLFAKYILTLDSVLMRIEGTVTAENLQARIRGNLLMAYANYYRMLVLATGNKSEAMVGYCTLYGDTVGALAPIGELYKTEVYEMARYINTTKEIIPIGIIDRVPTAELGPNQKDTDSLPPYDVLDAILDGYEANLTVAEIAEGVCDINLVMAVLDRVKNNKFKAAQSAPALDIGRG